MSGGIVGDDQSFSLLLEQFHTVWLQATPEDHMQRVVSQGDERPMVGFPRAMDELRAILERRKSRYTQADAHIQTSDKSVSASSAELIECIRSFRSETAP